MSRPSFSNIDLWLFELAEGNLTPDQVAQLELFILQNPELDIDRDMWEGAKLNSVPVSYPEEKSLYRRKPVFGYYGATAMVFLLILCTFGYSYFYFDAEGAFHANSENSVSANESAVSAREAQLKSEIKELQNLVGSLENQLKSERGRSSQQAAVEQSSVVSERNQYQQEFNQGVNETGSSRVVSLQTTNASQPPISQSEEDFTLQSSHESEALTALSGREEQSPFDLESNHFESFAQPAENEQANDPLSAAASLEPESLEPIASTRMELPSTAENIVITKKTTNATSGGTFGSNYEKSFKYRLSQFGRDMQRIMDNPLALQNFRDPIYHVPDALSNDLNFGATGTIVSPRVQTLSRLQWYGQPNEMMSNRLSIDGYSYALRGGIGVQMSHGYYHNGGIQSSDLALTYSPKFSINRNISVEPAFRFKVGNKQLNAGRMEGVTEVEMMQGNTIAYYSDGTTPIGKNLWYKDLGLGLNVNTKWFYASAQVDNVFRHQDNIYSHDLANKRRAGSHFVFTAGTDWESRRTRLNSKQGVFGLSPYFVYQKFESVDEAWLGANFRWHWFTLGGGVSSNLDPAASIGMKFKHFSVIYNADYLQSNLTQQRSLSHQVTLRIVGKPNRIGQRLLNL